MANAMIPGVLIDTFLHLSPARSVLVAASTRALAKNCWTGTAYAVRLINPGEEKYL